MKKRRRAAAIVTAALALLLVGPFGGCVGPDTDDSETHFLTFCHGSCHGDLECLCGVCTKKCTDASSCPAMPGSVCDDSCSQTSTSVCDVTCERDRDCTALGAGFACSDGRCRQTQSADAGSGGTGSGGAGSGGAASASADGSTDGSSGRSADARAGDGGPPSRESGVPSACRANPDPTPTLPSSAAMDPSAVARAATVIGACWPDDGIDRNARHLWNSSTAEPRVYYRFASQLDCLANSNCGCDAIEHCIGWSLERLASDPCESTCEGSVWKGCSDGLRGTTDCGRLGLECSAEKSCVEGEPVACEVATFVPTCTADGRSSRCDRGMVWHGPPCESLGLACKDGVCVGTGSPCQAPPNYDGTIEPFGMGCTPDGKTLDACVNGGRSQVDCSTRGPGFSCQRLPGGEAFCGLAAECSPAPGGMPSSTPPSCDGDFLTFCNAGRLERMDCKAFGFVGCDIDRRFGRYGCIDERRCGNGVVDNWEQCDDGNDDLLDGCATCGWSCSETDSDCNWSTANPCLTYVCQSDHSCAPGAPRPDGTRCSEESPTSYQDGTCKGGVCELFSTCSFWIGTEVFDTNCIDPDGNRCNGAPVCESPSSPGGSCGAMSPPLAPGTSCGRVQNWVCDANHDCVPSKCGNGVVDVDTGEQCDPPLQGNCGPDCRTTTR